jgi:hypothetical protein
MTIVWTYEPTLRRFYRWYASVARSGCFVAVLHCGRRIVGEPIGPHRLDALLSGHYDQNPCKPLNLK